MYIFYFHREKPEDNVIDLGRGGSIDENVGFFFWVLL